jgi:thymidylate synthase ThyX
MCWHPLIGDTLKNNSDDIMKDKVFRVIMGIKEAAQSSYKTVYEYLKLRNVSTKQARGAARGLLPNALSTQLIFSASLSQWNHIFSMRCSPHADAEIRNIMIKAKEIIYG